MRLLTRGTSRTAAITLSAVAMLAAATDPASARSDRDGRPRQTQAEARSEVPRKLIVSIRRQRITLWEGMRKIAEAPISSGRPGFETPTGVFSILQKSRVHFSNLYDSAPMPFMQRLTWSGVALHAGMLPGYPASHGCIRMPYSFAKQLFEMTRPGVRVIVARDEPEPQAIAHPKLPVPLPPTEKVAAATGRQELGQGGNSSADLLIGVSTAAAQGVQPAYVPQRTRAAVAAARAAHIAGLAEAIARAAAERDLAEARAKDALAETRSAEAAVGEARAAIKPLTDSREAARRQKTAAEAQLRIFVNRNRNDGDEATLGRLALEENELEQRILAAAFEIEDLDSEIAERLRHVAELAEAASAAGSRQSEASAALVEANARLKDAQATKSAADRALQRLNLPITVFVSRRSGKVSVRQGYEPLFDAKVEIDDPEAPLGTHVFTALEYAGDERMLEWSVVSLPAAPTEAAASRSSRTRDRSTRPAPPEAEASTSVPRTPEASLSRLHIPNDVLERIAEHLKPGSTFMISDLDISNETGKFTDIILLTR